VWCAHEIIVTSYNSNLEVAFLKLDFKKAFDSVSWDFILELIQARALREK